MKCAPKGVNTWFLCRVFAILICLIALRRPASADSYSFALANPDIFGSLTFVSGNPNYDLQIVINAASDIPGPETDALYGIAFQVNRVLTVTDTVYSISGVTEADISGKTETPTGNSDSTLPGTTDWVFTATSAGNATNMTWMIGPGKKADLIMGAPASGNTYPNLQGNSFAQHNPFYLTNGNIVFDINVPNLRATDKIASGASLQFGPGGTSTYSVIFTDTVPEPDTVTLLCSGILLVGIGVYRKQRP